MMEKSAEEIEAAAKLRRRAEEVFASRKKQAAVDKVTEHKLLHELQVHQIELEMQNQELQLALAEKEVMMREIHHRVKNNLQMISSLLGLQSGYVKDEQARHLFEDSQQRIRALALVHERLYGASSMRFIDYTYYVPSLVNSITSMHPDIENRVMVKFDIQDMVLSVDIAIPCGLILNELVSNVYKHAFPDQQRGEFSVAMRHQQDGKIRIQVGDNGVGLPAGFDLKINKTFGLYILQTIVKRQLGGSLKLENRKGGGTEATIEFDPNY